MSADKSKASVLVEELDAQATWVPSGPAGVMRRSAAELRRLSALEAERDHLHAEVMEQARLLGISGERELALRAEIERMRKDAEAMRADVAHWHSQFMALLRAVADGKAMQPPPAIIISADQFDAALKLK